MNLYEQTKENYMFPDRVQFDRNVYQKSIALAKKYFSMLKRWD